MAEYRDAERRLGIGEGVRIEPIARAKPLLLPRLQVAKAAAVARRPQRLVVATPIRNKVTVHGALLPKLRIASLPTLQNRAVPAVQQSPAVVIGNFVLFPDIRARTVSFMLKAPLLVSASVLIERNAEFRTLGGTVTLVTSLFPNEELQTQHGAWTAALASAGVRSTAWRFVPLSINRLTATLDLPETQRSADVRATTSAQQGTATFLAELTPLGAQAWKDALERGSALPGVCRLNASFASRDPQDRPAVRTQVAHSPVQALAHGAGPSALHVVNPENEVSAALVVDGHPTLEAVALEMRSSSSAARAEVFGSEGGTMNLRVASTDLASMEVEWSARVSFHSASWPAVRAGGVLSTSAGWAELINPASWIRQVSVTMMLIGNDGRVVTEARGSDRVTGSLDFTADFLEGESGLQTTFEATSELSTTILTPRPPGTEPGDLKLTVVAFRDGRDDMVVRNLSSDEQWVLVKVYPNARVEITSNLSASSESDPIPSALNELAPAGFARQAVPRIHTSPRRAATARPPLFRLEAEGAPFWALEVSTDPTLMLEQNAGLRTQDNYFSSVDPSRRLSTAVALRLPERVWQRLSTAPRLYYRGWTSTTGHAWTDAKATVADAIIDEVPNIELLR